MRGYQHPAIRTLASEAQLAFGGLSRHRRTKLARAANTTLVMAHQWSRGEATPPEVASALDASVLALAATGKKPA
jgi:hypothetical protein